MSPYWKRNILVLVLARLLQVLTPVTTFDLEHLSNVATTEPVKYYCSIIICMNYKNYIKKFLYRVHVI